MSPAADLPVAAVGEHSGGAKGNDILVYSWTATSSQARLLRVIPVPRRPEPRSYSSFLRFRKDQNEPGSTNAWPQKLAVSPDGSQLLCR